MENTRQDEIDLSDSMSIDPADLVELGLTPEILKELIMHLIHNLNTKTLLVIN